ncbi:MAG: hypothetical protein MZW92_38160 [Comamonadaceae bacterium]|nr:hypothetical protein [Comamonadaceae bacterium]
MWKPMRRWRPGSTASRAASAMPVRISRRKQRSALRRALSRVAGELAAHLLNGRCRPGAFSRRRRRPREPPT